jgi:hypothetical protein
VRGHDFYPTCVEAVDGLLRCESLPGVLWDPCCGDGGIVLPLRDRGFVVHASDLIGWGCPDSLSGQNFLLAWQVPKGVTGIVTNPPYRHARRFVEQALSLVPYVAMLLRLNFLESVGRKEWFEGGCLARVWVSSARLPDMHRHGWTGKKARNSVAYAWFVWEAGHCGRPSVGWF